MVSAEARAWLAKNGITDFEYDISDYQLRLCAQYANGDMQKLLEKARDYHGILTKIKKMQSQMSE